MPDIIDQQAEIVSKKRLNKKYVFMLGGGVLLLLLVVAAVFVFISRPKTPAKQNPDSNTTQKEETVIPSSQTKTYKLEMPMDEAVNSFIYFGQQTSVFSPLTAYTLTKGNRLISTPLSISASAQNGNPWCEGMGKSKDNLSHDQKAVICLENVDNRSIKIRKVDLRKNEYKEFDFALKGKDLFLEARTARVVASRDGDSAIIYSPAGAFVFEAVTGNLHKLEIPLNLDITKAVNISNVEVALITFDNKLFRVNYSSKRGGVFEINFTGTPLDKLTYGLSTARLSKDGKKIVYTITDKFDVFPTGGDINYPGIVAYNIDLNSAKVADELSYEEKFLLTCTNLVSDKYCVYKNTEKSATDKGDDKVLYIREFDKPITELVRIKNGKLTTEAQLEIAASTNGYVFVKAPFNYTNLEDKKEGMPITYFFNAENKSLVPLSY